MDPLDDTTKKPLSSRSTLFFVASIIGVQLLIALIVYPFLPAIVPIHWDAEGHVNGYGPKWVNTFLFPLISLGIFLLVRVLMSITPNMGSTNKRVNIEIVDRILVGVFLFMLAVQLIVVAQSFHLIVNISFVVSLILSILFLYIGNYLGKLQRNFWAGIRTPWTLLSETVWERTHRFGGWLFFATGAIGIVLSFVPLPATLRLLGITGLIVLDVVLMVVYSYLVYRRLDIQGEESSTSPFDGNS